MYVKKRNRNILYPNRINQNRTLQVFVNSFDNFLYIEGYRKIFEHFWKTKKKSGKIPAQFY